jgi:hypothetical protein
MKMFTSETTIEDLMTNPNDYGMPTFDEFRKNKSKYMANPEEKIAAIDRGDPMLGCFQKYYVEYGLKKYGPLPLETLERIAIAEGLSLHHDFIEDPQLKEDGRGGFYNEVTFRPNPMAIKRLKA